MNGMVFFCPLFKTHRGLHGAVSCFGKVHVDHPAVIGKVELMREHIFSADFPRSEQVKGHAENRPGLFA